MKKLLFALLVLIHSSWIQANTQYTDTLIVDDVALTYDGYSSGILQRAQMQLTIHTADCFSVFSAVIGDDKYIYDFSSPKKDMNHIGIVNIVLTVTNLPYKKMNDTTYVVELDSNYVWCDQYILLMAKDDNNRRRARSTVLYTVDYIKDSTIVKDMLGETAIEDIPARSLNIWYKQGVIGVNGITADEIADLSVYDATGKRVAGSKHETTADVSHLNKGIYIVRTRTKNNQIKTKKIAL